MAMQRKARLTLLALALVCVLPVAASYLAYYVWPPEGQVNYGELIEPTPLPAALAAAAPAVEGRWTLVYASSGACDAACRRALYYMRQVRTAQAEQMDRVERLWLRAGGEPVAPADQDGLVVAAVDDDALTALPATARILLMDPRGKLMMRFPAEPDPKRMIRDLSRLLKYSRLG